MNEWREKVYHPLRISGRDYQEKLPKKEAAWSYAAKKWLYSERKPNRPYACAVVVCVAMVKGGFKKINM